VITIARPAGTVTVVGPAGTVTVSPKVAIVVARRPQNAMPAIEIVRLFTSIFDEPDEGDIRRFALSSRSHVA
jgi:hypothetical protein